VLGRLGWTYELAFFLPDHYKIFSAWSVFILPQAGCSHHKQLVVLNEYRHDHPHLAETKSKPVPPATDQTTGVANAKVDTGFTQPTATSGST
jgi:hypothetical protein